MTTLTAVKDKIYDFDENSILDRVSTISIQNCAAAYSCRLLLSSYTGPMINIRRSADNATMDFYGNYHGELGTTLHGNGISLSSWLNGSTGYVTLWYDQSGYNCDLQQLTNNNQPTIDLNGNITYNGVNTYLNNVASTPLTAANKTYTFMSTWTPTSTNSGCIFDQATTGYPSNSRASMVQIGANYGFSGTSNDWYSLPIQTGKVRKSVMICNHNLTTNNILLHDNNSVYKITTNSTPTNLSVGTDFCNIGRNNNSAEYFTGYINEFIIFNINLTIKESQVYFQPITAPCQKMSSTPKTQLLGLYKDPSPIPTNWIIAFDMQMLSNITSGTGISSWGGGTAFNSPTYFSSGGDGQQPYVNFNRANSQYLNFGSKTFNIATNGGFTAIAYLQFTGSAGNYERIFDFGSGANALSIIEFSRDGTLSDVYFSATNSSGTSYGNCGLVANSSNSGNWTVFAVRYTASNRLQELFVNGILNASSTASAAWTNRTKTNTYIGKDRFGTSAYLNANVAGLYVYDRSLTNTEMSSITNHLRYSTISTLPRSIADYTQVYKSGYVQTYGFRNNRFSTYFSGNTSDYINVTDVPAPPLSYCFWVYTINSNYYTIVGLSDSNRNGSGWGIQVDYNSVANTITVYCALPTAWSSFNMSGVNNNAWYHVCITLNTNYTVQGYLNGTYVNSVTGTGMPPSASCFWVGGSGDLTRGFNGYIDDFRVYDYILRAEEVASISDNVNELHKTFTPPDNYIVNTNNWYSVMSNTSGSSFTPVSGASPPNVQYQLTSSVNGGNSIFYNSARIQDYQSFKCTFEFYTANAVGDQIFFFCGATTQLGILGTSTKGGFLVGFQIYNSGGATAPQGINLYNQSGTLLVNVPYTLWINYGWTSVTITYRRGTINTWIINFLGHDIIVYSDPNNSSWLSSSGSYWGIGCWSGAAHVDSYIRRVELSYTPYSVMTPGSLRDYQGTSSLSINSVYNYRALIDGLTWKLYNGYFGDSVSYFNTNTYINIGRSINMSTLRTATVGELNLSNISFYSIEWIGYFKATVSGVWTFYTNSDDSSFLWIGSTAVSGYTTTNALVKNGGIHVLTTVSATVTLNAGTYYPIRIQYGNNSNTGDCQVSFTPPSGVRTYNGNGYFFSSIGNDPNYPAESAKVIKDLTGTNKDGIYFINVNGSSTQVYCLMNDHYDGGGWMLLMKGAAGSSTFSFNSTYWTTTNTLNSNDLGRASTDAKFNVFNYNNIKDIMAIWPDISPTSYTNVYGLQGGAFLCNDGWVWKYCNWNGATRTTALAGFQNSRFASQSNPFVNSGYSSSLWSHQTGNYAHVIGGGGGIAWNGAANSCVARWGFIFNNEANLSSCDTMCGIGLYFSGSQGTWIYSAGDIDSGVGAGAGITTGINRTAAFQLFGR